MLLNKSKKVGKAKKSSLGLSIMLAITAPALLGAYGWNAGVVSDTATRGLAELDHAVITKIVGQTVSYNKTIMDNTAVINDALKVAITQEAATSQEIAVQDRNAKQASVAAYQAQAVADDLINLELDYGGATGQGYATCKVLQENKQLDSAVTTAALTATEKVLNTDNAPGAIAVDNKLALKERQEIHNSNYCSEEEVDMGLCPTASPVPGGDSNANVLFMSAAPGTKVSAAKAAVRQNILGSPTLSVPKKAGGTIAGQAYLANVNRKTALSAFPAYSLAYLESMSETRDDLKDSAGNPQSPNDVLFNTVTRYYGGKDSEEWVKKMIAQQPRGLLVELAKMEGLGAWMDHEEYLANQRIEGTIAAMTIVSALPLEEALARQEQSLTKRSLGAGLR